MVVAVEELERWCKWNPHELEGRHSLWLCQMPCHAVPVCMNHLYKRDFELRHDGNHFGFH